MEILGGIVIGFCCLMLGWKLGKERAHNDQLDAMCHGCTDYDSYEAAKLDIRALEEMLAKEKRSNAQLRGEISRLQGKLHYQNNLNVARG